MKTERCWHPERPSPQLLRARALCRPLGSGGKPFAKYSWHNQFLLRDRHGSGTTGSNETQALCSPAGQEKHKVIFPEAPSLFHQEKYKKDLK